MPKHFYNTINLSGENLQKANARALAQETLIREIYKANPEKKFSPSQMQELFARKYDRHHPITSLRRAMTNLTYSDNDSFLRKTEEQVMGNYGQPEHLWELNKQSCSDEELQQWFSEYQDGKHDEPQPQEDSKPRFIQSNMF